MMDFDEAKDTFIVITLLLGSLSSSSENTRFGKILIFFIDCRMYFLVLEILTLSKVFLNIQVWRRRKYFSIYATVFLFLWWSILKSHHCMKTWNTINLFLKKKGIQRMKRLNKFICNVIFRPIKWFKSIDQFLILLMSILDRILFWMYKSSFTIQASKDIFTKKTVKNQIVSAADMLKKLIIYFFKDYFL